MSSSRILLSLIFFVITFSVQAQIGFDYPAIYQEILEKNSISRFIQQNRVSNCTIGIYDNNGGILDSLNYKSEVTYMNNDNDTSQCIKIMITHISPKRWSIYRQKHLKFHISIKSSPSQSGKCLFSETYAATAKVKLSRKGIKVKMKKMFIINSSAKLL